VLVVALPEEMSWKSLNYQKIVDVDLYKARSGQHTLIMKHCCCFLCSNLCVKSTEFAIS
jgi:hypothetical protein